MNEHELFEKFALFLARRRIQYLKGDIPPGERKILIEKFLNSKVVLECRNCDRGYLREARFEPKRTVPTQIRCRHCNGTGKRSTTVRDMITISKMA